MNERNYNELTDKVAKKNFRRIPKLRKEDLIMDMYNISDEEVAPPKKITPKKPSVKERPTEETSSPDILQTISDFIRSPVT